MLRTRIISGRRILGTHRTLSIMAWKSRSGRSRRNMKIILTGVGLVLCALYYVLQYEMLQEAKHDLGMGRDRRYSGSSMEQALKPSFPYIENSLQEALLMNLHSSCTLPELDPFAEEVARFDQRLPRIKCPGRDWVKCYHSKCRVVDSIKATVSDISCEYRDILFHSDQNHTIGGPTVVAGAGEYQLAASDHVKVACSGRLRLIRWIDFGGKSVQWSGLALGFRPLPPPPAPPRREDPYNVLLFGFDSTARNGFIRRMPKSWQTLKELGFTVMEGYNIVGDGTPAALCPILTGKTEQELQPDVRQSKHANAFIDSFPFIFDKLRQDGYRTAFFEDRVDIGTFQYRFNGFRHQPTDHYLRAFFLEQNYNFLGDWWTKNTKYCVGDTPQFRLMMNITSQFMELGGKRFIFTFIVDITHDDFNVIESADEDTAEFLRSAMRWADDTLIVVFGDHGPRFSDARATYQGKLEERLPLLALRLPSRMPPSRGLHHNVRALTTPHDLHATILDVLAMTEHQNPYTVPGARMKRGLSMLEPIPLNRSCSEAGIEPHWCACLEWTNVSNDDPFYARTGQALVGYINSLFDSEVRYLCVPRTLTSTEWVLRYRPNSRPLSGARDADSHVGRFNTHTKLANDNYQVKIVVGPGRGVFEASMIYLAKEDEFVINTRDISRTNAYGKEPSCISEHLPHLNPFCYCRRVTEDRDQ